MVARLHQTDLFARAIGPGKSGVTNCSYIAGNAYKFNELWRNPVAWGITGALFYDYTS
jgi:hypothetical protein